MREILIFITITIYVGLLATVLFCTFLLGGLTCTLVVAASIFIAHIVQINLSNLIGGGEW